MTSVVVTGASGFVGSHLVARFTAEGFDVWGSDVRPPNAPTPDVRQAIEMLNERDRFRQADLTDVEAVLAMLDEIGPDGIVHAGGVVGPEAATADAPLAVQVNVVGTQNLLEYAKHHKARFTFLSTATLYGTDPELRLLHEAMAPRPVGMYDATKLMGETLLDAYKRTYGVVGCALRFGFPYGPGQWIDQYFVPRVLKGEPVVEPDGGDHPCDFTFIDDLVDGIFRGHTAPVLNHDVYNITGGVLRTRGEFAQAVLAAVPGARIELGPGYQKGRHLRGACDISLARNDLGYQPRYSIEQGVREWVARLA
jgi:nucleoside-diphosphate-sugar epimerase